MLVFRQMTTTYQFSRLGYLVNETISVALSPTAFCFHHFPMLLPITFWQPTSSSAPYDFLRHGESSLLWYFQQMPQNTFQQFSLILLSHWVVTALPKNIHNAYNLRLPCAGTGNKIDTDQPAPVDVRERARERQRQRRERDRERYPTYLTNLLFFSKKEISQRTKKLRKRLCTSGI